MLLCPSGAPPIPWSKDHSITCLKTVVVIIVNMLPRAPSGPHHFFARRMHREGSGVGVRQSLPATGSGPVKLYLETRRGVVATRPRFFRPQETEMRETRAETSRQSRTAEAVTSRPPPPLSAGNRAARLEDRRTKSGGRPEAREWHLACWGQDQMASGLQSVLRRNRTAFCMMLLPVAGIDWVSRLSSSPVPPRLERRPHGRARAGVEPVEGAPTTGHLAVPSAGISQVVEARNRRGGSVDARRTPSRSGGPVVRRTQRLSLLRPRAWADSAFLQRRVAVHGCHGCAGSSLGLASASRRRRTRNIESAVLVTASWALGEEPTRLSYVCALDARYRWAAVAPRGWWEGGFH
ncbi:unnamed protein product [Diplocarpon coronariae]|nr:hypothetical protein JHW43_003572 [Diplocarpon mali]